MINFVHELTFERTSIILDSVKIQKFDIFVIGMNSIANTDFYADKLHMVVYSNILFILKTRKQQKL